MAERQEKLRVNDVGEAGIAFSYGLWPYYWAAVVVVCGAVGLLGFAIAAAGGGSIDGVLVALVFAGLGLSMLWYVVTMLRVAPGVVVISPSGIYRRSLVFEHFVPWDAVTEVVARNHDTPWITVKALPLPGTRMKGHLSRFVKGTEGLPFMIIRAHWLGPNAVPAYLALSRYFYAPEQRAELAGL